MAHEVCIGRAPPDLTAHMRTHCWAHPIQHFYEKVVKVKADVAAILINSFSETQKPPAVTWELSRASPKGGVHLDP
jgi:hypothetical protein